jgi:methylmalonyl-CoA mutase N-terminal domain/subunit
MYRGRPWTMRQYAGFGMAKETNERFKYLTENGQTGLSVAFDLPTQMGRDSDHQLALGEVGKVGVAIDSLLDMRDLFDGIPLRDVSTSMTINATASILLLLYSLVAEEQGTSAEDVTGTTQNDILKEYLARGTYVYPPEPSMRVTTDMFAYCARELPRWNTISISGYHIREAGSTAVQELAFTLSNAIAYVEAAVEAGLEVEEFAPRLSFFFNAHSPAGREQHSQDHRAGALRRTRRHPKSSHQRLRRGTRPPDRAQRTHRAADAAGPGERGRRDRHSRPAGRLLLRRVAYRRR